MRRFLLFNWMILAALSINAQTDITQYYLSNHGFDENFDYTATSTQNVAEEIKNVQGWTAELSASYTIVGTYEFGFGGVFNSATVPAKGYDGEQGGGLAISTGWSQTFVFYQTITLPAGTYTLNVPTYNGSADKTEATSQVAWVPQNGSAVRSNVNRYPTRQWTLDQITFTLTKTTTGRIQFGMKAAANGSANSAKLVIDYVQLIGENMVIDKSELQATITSANNFYGDGTGNGAEELKLAIEAAQAVADNDNADLITVLEATQALNEAIAAYRNQNVSEQNPKDCTQYITNPSFENGTKGWNAYNLQTQTNSDFPKKAGSTYLEKWTSSGNAVGYAYLSQTIKNLPNGVYKLTAAAMNYSQSDKTKKNTGAVIFAGEQEEPVYTPDDYSVKFTNISGEVEIGFMSGNATGNWIAVDNFRLYLIGYVDAGTAVAELQRITAEAEALLPSTMSATAHNELQNAIDAAKLITTDSDNEDIQTASKNLRDAITHAQTSIEDYQRLATLITEAEKLQDNMMNGNAATMLQSALDDARKIDGTATDDEVQKVTTSLSTAMEAAQASIAEYEALAKAVKVAEEDYDAGKQGANELNAEIDKAKTLLNNPQATSQELADEVETLEKVRLAYNLANATPGTGTAPKVTETNHYVATGATEALMRATMSGSNILERGVCWSTNHEPTVLDNRTTKSFTLKGTIFHVKGMQPSTVYYLRPYVMNKTYTVAYGDEVKIVTHPKGTCTWSWDEGAPTDEANERCRKAMEQTIAYFNEWTGIKGFHLSGHYGAQTQTADCSYGGWMRIGPNAAYQAIGTVLHETGHGVGVGTHWRWNNCSDTRERESKYGKWLGREANDVLHFLENYGGDEVFFTGDAVHGWGSTATGASGNASISYDWLVNGADKDKHTELQYIGGMCILHGLFIDGLCPTDSDPNGISGYTYNFDDAKKYYLMNKNVDCGLGLGVLYQRTSTAVAWQPNLVGETLADSAAWYMEFNPKLGYYMFKNVETGKYLTHASGSTTVSLKATDSPTRTEQFQLMPDRTDVTIGTGKDIITTHGYWFTWNDSGNKSMQANKAGKATGYGTIAQANFSYSNSATAQQWIIISEDELEAYRAAAVATGIQSINLDDKTVSGSKTVVGIYNTGGMLMKETQKGLNIIRYSDGTTRKIFVK